jgi:hypothetical protein
MEKKIKDLIKRHWNCLKDKENGYGKYSKVYPKKVHAEYVRNCIEESGFENTKLRLECVIEHGMSIEHLYANQNAKKPKRKYKKKVVKKK